MSDSPNLERTTLRHERLRMAFTGPVHAAAMGSGVFQLVALQHFEASNEAKSFLAGALYLGLLFSPFFVNIVARLRLSVSRAAAGMMVIAGSSLVVAALSHSFSTYLIAILLGTPLFMGSTPLLTAMWRQNVGAHNRGRHYGLVEQIGVGAKLLTGAATAWWMGDDASRYPPVLIALAVCLFFAAVLLWRIPTAPLEKPAKNPLRVMSLLWRDPLFGYVSLAWFFIGFANLSTIPLRTEYAGSPDIGLGYDADTVLLLTSVIPPIAAIFALPLWGRLFDRSNFILLRIGINLTFMGSILFFFMPSFTAQVVGAALFGVGAGGGGVAWSLWVTKFAPPDRTADYMAVHTFLTGLRGITGPYLMFWLLSGFDFGTVAMVASGLIVFSCLLLVPIIPKGARGGRLAESA